MTGRTLANDHLDSALTEPGAGPVPLIEVTGITKRYGSLVANHSIDFSVERGEIHALLGENGAGKTTLAGALFGAVQPDSGTVSVEGRKVRIASPHDALALGIGMVYQHFMLVPELTVAENVVLGSRPAGLSRLVRREIEAAVKRVADDYGLDVDVTADAGDLPIDLQQKVEILRCLYRNARVLILDEPTAVLGPIEIARLFVTLRALREKGCGIVIITHKAAEVMEIADRATILRSGEVRDVIPRCEFSERRLTGAMVEGFVPSDTLGVARAGGGNVVLNIAALCASSDQQGSSERRNVLDDVDLEVRAGEIVGIAGVEGNGQSEFVEVLCGERPSSGGTIVLNDRSLVGMTPGQRRGAGLAMVPEDRKAAGLIEAASIEDNLLLGRIVDGRYSRRGFLRRSAMRSAASELIDEYDIRPRDPRTIVGTLSGGNQQRIVLARAIAENPQVLIAAHPTRGLDVSATHFVHQRLLSLRSMGRAVIMLSTDLDELVALSDRIAVFYRGRIDLIIPREEFDAQRLARAMAGIKA